MEMHIAACDKLGYLIGDTLQPSKLSSTYSKWCTENFRVKGWLIDSMSPHLMSRLIRLSTAKEIWDAIKKTYYDGGDETYIFYLNKRAFTIKQNGPLEIDHCTPNRLHCDADVTERQIELDRLHVHIFLAVLDPEFDQVRGEILLKDPKLDLDQTFAYVCREAQQRLTMASVPETVVMVTQRQWGPQISTDGSSQTKVIGSRLEHKFTHCGGSKHSRVGCYKLIRYPNWWDHSETPRKNSSKALNTSSDSDPVSPAISITSALASTSVATTGTQGYVLHSSSKKHTWIIDIGATDYMTFDPGQIASHAPPPQLDILSSKTIGCGTSRSKLHYLDLASDSAASISQAYKIWGASVEKHIAEGQSVPSFNSSIKWWRLSFMPEFRFFVLTMAENFPTIILTSSHKIMASYINAHAPTLPNKMESLKERTEIYWK
ncbi:unnamed protein product [Prunus armeniaca]